MIRQLDPSDMTLMAKLHGLGFDNAWPETDMSEHLKQDFCLGLGTPLKAFVIFRCAADQAEILTIITAPENRKSGLARQLLQYSEDVLCGREIDIVFLEVAEDNAAAIALYSGLGYEQFSRRPAYYRREEGRVAALTFRKRLDASPAFR